jgi:hypothetical protein
MYPTVRAGIINLFYTPLIVQLRIAKGGDVEDGFS